jgi:hypothetical protein
MSLSATHTYDFSYTLRDYDYKEGDMYLIKRSSWSDSGKECPHPQQVCVCYIDAQSSNSYFGKGKIKFQYFEGGDKDFFHIHPKYLIRFSTKHTPEQFEAVKEFQSQQWDEFLAGNPSTNTYQENLQIIIGLLGSSYSSDVDVKDTYTGTYTISNSIMRDILSFTSDAAPTFLKRDNIKYWASKPITMFDNEEIHPIGLNITLANGFVQEYQLTLEDVYAMQKDFDRKVSAEYIGSECACGCGEIIQTGVVHVTLACGCRFITDCHEKFLKSTIQDKQNIKLDVSDCPMGCVECLQDTIRTTDGHVFPRSSISSTLVAESSGNFIGVCNKCNVLFSRGPRVCAELHGLPNICPPCSPQSSWPCRECDLMHQHSGGCRHMKCCPRYPAFDDERCDEYCDHKQIIDGVLIAKGCGAKYKMDDGEVQDLGEGAAVSDGSYYG